eukprot:GDKH01013204.1.p1 GENE.GDKH01013204.1~~GDKH01013204.1.p1  ORF type:complete len:78 (-),score=8.22 GDKH01013204.1:34-240(-)
MSEDSSIKAWIKDVRSQIDAIEVDIKQTIEHFAAVSQDTPSTKAWDKHVDVLHQNKIKLMDLYSSVFV